MALIPAPIRISEITSVAFSSQVRQIESTSRSSSSSPQCSRSSANACLQMSLYWFLFEFSPLFQIQSEVDRSSTACRTCCRPPNLPERSWPNKPSLFYCFLMSLFQTKGMILYLPPPNISFSPEKKHRRPLLPSSEWISLARPATTQHFLSPRKSADARCSLV
jgi:hypothetical protein